MRYRTKPDRADENQALVEQVFARARTPRSRTGCATRPSASPTASASCTSPRSTPPTAPTRSPRLAAFDEFLRDIADRCEEGRRRGRDGRRLLRLRSAEVADAWLTATARADRPWVLTTPSGGSEYTAYRDEAADPPALVVQVGKTQLRYHLRCIDDLHAMLARPATGCRSATPTSRSPPPTARSRRGARADDNPVGGWYGLKKGLRGRFANYVPPVLERLGLAEVEHNARNNRMRADARDAACP